MEYICYPQPVSFLTNVFDDVEAVADRLRALSIAQQPEKKENRKYMFGHTGSYLLYASFYCQKDNAAVLLVHSSTSKHKDEFSIKANRVNPSSGLLFALFDESIKTSICASSHSPTTQ